MEPAHENMTEKKTYKAVIIRTEHARLIAEHGARMHLTYKYLPGITDGQQLILCSKYSYKGVVLLRLHAVVSFQGSRFLPDSAIESFKQCHLLNIAEYEMLRVSWPRASQRRDGAVAWQFDLVDALGDLWVFPPLGYVESDKACRGLKHKCNS